MPSALRGPKGKKKLNHSFSNQDLSGGLTREAKQPRVSRHAARRTVRKNLRNSPLFTTNLKGPSGDGRPSKRSGVLVTRHKAKTRQKKTYTHDPSPSYKKKRGRRGNRTKDKLGLEKKIDCTVQKPSLVRERKKNSL